MITKLFDGIRQGQSNVFRCLRVAKELKSPDKLAEWGKKALFWGGVSAGLFGLVFGFELLGELLEDGVTALFEFIEEGLETLYRKNFKMDQYHAQMATAYTGFLTAMAVGYLLFRKLSVFFKDARLGWRMRHEKAKETWSKYCLSAEVLWTSMDSFNKCFAVIGLVVLAIPIIAIICLVLGKAFAELV